MKSSNRNSDFNNLNDQLGSFNLEPPKMYRDEQKERINSEYFKKREEKTKRKSKSKSTKRTKRKLKKSVRNVLLGAIIVICTAIILVVLSLTVLFKIETITINGNQKYTTQQILSVLPIEEQSNLFVANVDSASQKLEVNLPYIYDVQIKRKLPSTIVVNITEATKYYAIKDKDTTYILLDDNLKVLEKGIESPPEPYVLLDNVAVNEATQGHTVVLTDEKIQKSIIDVNQAVKDLQIDTVTSIYAVDSDNNYIVHDNRIIINLGKTDNLENKLYTALASIEKLEQSNHLTEGELNVSTDKQTYFTEKR